MKMEEWKNEVSRIYDSLPDKFKTYRWKVCFKSIAVDWLLLQDIFCNNSLAIEVGKILYKIVDDFQESYLDDLVSKLNSYYFWRREDKRWEQGVFGSLKKKTLCPIFVLSYNRWGNNALLHRFELYNDKEIFDKTIVFIEPDQKDKYYQNHPKFNYYTKKVDSVGERMLAVLDFCYVRKIRYFIVLEDDVYEFRHIKKGGVDKNNLVSNLTEEWKNAYLKYFYYKSLEVMQKNSNCVLVGIRNRALCNNERTSLIGYNDPMRGGCPNMAFFIDIKRFLPIFLQIPRDHYSPQYDWAIQCAIVKNKKSWIMLTGIVKDEYNSKSVINYDGDREFLAKKYLEYYGVEDCMYYRKFKETKLQGVKIFYNSRLCDNNLNKKLF